MSDYNRNYKESVVYARSKGLGVVVAAPEELFCDLDTEDDLNRFMVTATRLEKAGVLSAWKFITSKGGRWHGIATLHSNTYTTYQKIALQAIMGSDRRRELSAFLAELHGEENPIRRFVVEEPDGIPVGV